MVENFGSTDASVVTCNRPNTLISPWFANKGGKIFVDFATTVSSNRLVLATIRRYSGDHGTGRQQGGHDMQLHEYRAKLFAIRAFATPIRCPDCGDVMVAPVSSEFVEGGEIRHHWQCDSCGGLSTTSIQLTSH